MGAVYHHLSAVIYAECLTLRVDFAWKRTQVNGHCHRHRQEPPVFERFHNQSAVIRRDSESALSLFVVTAFGSRGPFQKTKPRRMIKSADVLDERV